MDLSVVMTVHDREAEVLLATLRSLHRGPMREAEIVVVNDRSTMGYEWIQAYAKARFPRFNWIDLPDYNGFRLDGGYGNPARAFNVGVQAATGSRLVLMSSDVIATPKVQNACPLNGFPWTPMIVDLDTCVEYCGPRRFFPMPWFLSCQRDAVLAVGGWDEAYLDGMCFEDNDFLGRLGCYSKALLADWNVTAWHQSHVQPAYDHSDLRVVEANQRNQEITLSKWGGIPFDSERTPFDVKRKPHPSGMNCLTFTFAQDRLDKIIAATRGLSVEV